jgi:hypothetical protein
MNAGYLTKEYDHTMLAHAVFYQVSAHTNQYQADIYKWV